MKYTPDKIGTIIQLKKGSRVFLKHLTTSLSDIVVWDKHRLTEGKLAFSSPAYLLAIDNDKGFAHVRLPFESESNDIYLVKV